MKRNAIIRIILWSIVLVVLLAIFLVLIYVPGANPFARNHRAEATHIPEPINGGSWEQASASGNAVKVDASQIRELEIEWVAGSIRIQPSDTEEIFFREENISGSGKPMQWKLRGEKLAIQYAEDGKFSLKAGLNWEDEKKDLIIEVPSHWECDSLEIAAAAASVEVSNITIRTVEFEGASGSCVFESCTVEKLDLDTASGDVRFTGSLQQLDCDAASADILLELINVPASLELDTASGDLEVTLPVNAGFTVSMDTLSGDFESDFATTMRNDDYVAGDGSCRIDVDAMSGDVVIRKGQ